MHPPLRLRCICVCLIVCLCSLAGCSSLPPASTGPALTVPDPGKYTAEFQSNWSYRCLDERLQTCYGSIYTTLTDRFDTDEIIDIKMDDTDISEHVGIKVLLPQTLSSKEEAQRLYDAFFHDNPQFFYISSVYSLEGYMEKDAPRYDQINLLYTMGKEQRTAAVGEMDAIVDDILKSAPETDDQFETELYLHDRLASLCSYDTAAAAAGYSLFPQAYTAYGALVKGLAVCEGYSRAMQLLLKRVGMECTLVTGHSVYNSESHMWNMVTVNGGNYHLDVTWNDTEDRLRHNYFNMNTAQTQVSHTIDEGQLGIDTCVNTAENYFVRSDTYIDTYERQTIAAAIARQVKSGADRVEIAMAPDKFDNALLFLKNATLTKQMVNAHLADSGVALWEYTLRGETKEHILTLYKK